MNPLQHHSILQYESISEIHTTIALHETESGKPSLPAGDYSYMIPVGIQQHEMVPIIPFVNESSIISIPTNLSQFHMKTTNFKFRMQ